MLLPVSASNPASMMAQALGIYKNLIGNNSQHGLPEISHTDFPKNIKDEAHSEEPEKDSNTTVVSLNPNDPGEPVFSLQSSKSED